LVDLSKDVVKDQNQKMMLVKGEISLQISNDDRCFEDVNTLSV